MTIHPLADGRPLRPLTRLLADMQTTINAAGLRLFDADMDRFVIFSLIVREGLWTSTPRPISAHSLSISLNRSFETVRRHVNALIASGDVARVRGGVVAIPPAEAREGVRAMQRLSNDAFVRFVEDFRALGGLDDAVSTGKRYDVSVGICGAVDVMLSTVDSNRGLHGDWLDLSLFSTVLCGNFHRYANDARAFGLAMGEAHAVRPSVIARTMGLAETTVRRRADRLTRPGGSMVAVRRGLLVSQDWLATAAAAATTAATLESVRREIRKAVARGFPIDAPATAYIDGRPPDPDFR